MIDAWDFDDIPIDVDLNGDGIPLRHDAPFDTTGGDPASPGINDGSIDRSGDGVPDWHGGTVDLDGSGLDYRIWVDLDGDGINDWDDPFVDTTGNGLSDHAPIRHQLTIEHVNPFYRHR